MDVRCECCVLSGIGLCDGLITCPEESYGCLCCDCCVLSGRVLCDGLITRPEESWSPMDVCLLCVLCVVR